jgi:hypothetical protein
MWWYDMMIKAQEVLCQAFMAAELIEAFFSFLGTIIPQITLCDYLFNHLHFEPVELQHIQKCIFTIM